MLCVIQVNERGVQSLAVGAPGKARLIGGLTVEGRIRHISSVDDEATRTFRVELEVPNPDRRIANGMTAEIPLPHTQAQAHSVSPSVLKLSANGEIGVKAVGDDNRVAFNAVTIVDAESEGKWIHGLPAAVNL